MCTIIITYIIAIFFIIIIILITILNPLNTTPGIILDETN